MSYFNVKHIPTGGIKSIYAETKFEAMERAKPLFLDFDTKNYKHATRRKKRRLK